MTSALGLCESSIHAIGDATAHPSQLSSVKVAAGDISGSEYWLTWHRWVVADVASIALIVPIATILLNPRVKLRRPQRCLAMTESMGEAAIGV